MTTAQAVESGGRVRPFDPFRDLEQVVTLIGIAFGDRLDPAGRVTLDRMRRLARAGPLLQWFWLLAGKATAAPGLVWDVRGHLVGNVSLRRSRSRGGYLIGNVVVHPEWQGRGIGRALMRAAMNRASDRGARWIGLEVRADNGVARELYGNLGFQEVGRTKHMLRPAGMPRGRSGPQVESLRRASSRDADALVRLMLSVIPAEQRPLLEIREPDYRPSNDRALEHWLRGEREVWWVADDGDGVCAASRVVRTSGRFPNRLEILVRVQHEGRFEQVLVRQGIDSLRGSPKKAIEAQLPLPADSAVAALEGAGFRKLRVLIQMKRSLKYRLSVNLKTAE
ncbi:MAG: GNAT family N-acetyltransferase [Anaerolineae bacterium]